MTAPRATSPFVLFAVLVLIASPLVGCSALMEELESAAGDDGSTAADGLREALRVGTGRAVDRLGAVDGYLKRSAVRIVVPDKLDAVAEALDRIGQDELIDEFVTSMNRAAEAAAPEARRIFVESIREMTFSDAMTILKGDKHEATDFFREHAGPRLADVFRPIVEAKLGEVGATRSFDRLMKRTVELPFVDEPIFDLEEYVTGRALDGLFLMLGREEERIRKDPAARTTELLRRWFGSR